MKSLDRREGRRVQETLRRLAWLLDVLVQHACRIISGRNDQRVTVEMTDGMPQRTPRAVFRVGLHVHVDDSTHIHPFVTQHDLRAVPHDFQSRARRSPNTADCNWIASENRVVLKWVIRRDCLLPGRRQQLNHRLWTASASVRDGGKQPRSEDVLARRQLCLFRRRLRTSRTVDVQGTAVLQFKRLEKTTFTTVARQPNGYAYFLSRPSRAAG